MNNNVKIAKELVKLAKSLIADDLPYTVENWCEQHGGTFNEATKRWDFNGDVEISQYTHLAVKNGHFAIAFGVIKGKFVCFDVPLDDLTGGPTVVEKSFYCNGCHLKSLKGAPEKVGWNFDCNANSLRNLDYAPSFVGNDFWCTDNPLPRDTKKPEGVKGQLVLNNADYKITEQ